jgi:hypothetical protein
MDGDIQVAARESEERVGKHCLGRQADVLISQVIYDHWNYKTCTNAFFAPVAVYTLRFQQNRIPLPRGEGDR